MTSEREARIRRRVETGAQMGDSMPELRAVLAALDEERQARELAVAALRFYAEVDNWRTILGSDLDTEYRVLDGGKRARAAVAADGRAT
jgi:hypothetical protein